MATQESDLRDQGVSTPVSEKLSMVVDRPSADGRALLILPFATAPGEEPLGRRVAELVRRRLSVVKSLVIGHGLLVATGPDGRRYVPLYTPLTDDQAYSCAAIWHANAVVSGSITLTPSLKWTMTLRDAERGKTLS